MSSTETRSGFRLPWSSDRSSDSRPESDGEPGLDSDAASGSEAGASDAAKGNPAAAAEQASGDTDGGWPELDLSARLAGRPEAGSGIAPSAHPGASPSASSPTPAPRPENRRPTKFLADLTAAMRAAAEASREQTVAQFQAETRDIVASIHASSASEADALRSRADGDVTAIREWSKAEIARIKEETETRISGRRQVLEQELEGHAATIERRIEAVGAALAEFEREMDTFFATLIAESDPTRFATLAEQMPVPPVLDLADLADVTDLASAGPAGPAAAVSATRGDDAHTADIPASDESLLDGEADAQAIADQDAASAELLVETTATLADGTSDSDVEVVADGAAIEDLEAAAAAEAEAIAAKAEATATEAAAAEPEVDPWGIRPRSAAVSTEPAEAPTTDDDQLHAPDGTPIDQSAIMAALEAAAEAVVAAEAAAESASQAEEAADLAETAAELLSSRMGDGDGWGDAEAAEADAAFAARLGAGGVETDSFVERLAGIQHRSDAADGEPRTTTLVVTGLVSVASIASFKRHLGRVAGVTAVSVSSGPEGEFLFSATHRPDVSFRDVIPALPGFGARVTATGDGTVTVTAHDPETDG